MCTQPGSTSFFRDHCPLKRPSFSSNVKESAKVFLFPFFFSFLGQTSATLRLYSSGNARSTCCRRRVKHRKEGAKPNCAPHVAGQSALSSVSFVTDFFPAARKEWLRKMPSDVPTVYNYACPFCKERNTFCRYFFFFKGWARESSPFFFYPDAFFLWPRANFVLKMSPRVTRRATTTVVTLASNCDRCR